MEKFIITFVSGIAVYLYFLVCWHKLLSKKINFKDYRLYLALIILTLTITCINIFLPQFLKLIGSIIVMFVINGFFFCRNITKNLLVVLYSDLIVFISEFIFTFILTLVMGRDLYNFAPSNTGIFIVNIGVAIIAFAFLKFNFIYSVFNYLNKTFDNMKKSNLIIYFILTIALISIFLIILYMDLPLTFLLVCTCLLTIFYISMLFRLANARENYRAINSKYETSLSSLKEYEEMMDRYRVTNHENKNQLLTIRNMVDKKDKKTINYIDELVDNKIKDNETIFYKTSKIPEGGLRAIIYSKLCKMKDLKIKYTLDISNDIKTVDLIELEESTILNICKIIGVFLDNSIDAVKPLRNKNVIIEMYIMNNNLCIDISNNHKGNIEIDKLSNKKHTTKGRGHGYGLALVKEIIKEDNSLEHESEVNKDLFTQRLIIKM